MQHPTFNVQSSTFKGASKNVIPSASFQSKFLRSLNRKSKIKNRKSFLGFTLIEVLIVVVIAALAASIALPGFVRTLSGSQLRTASRTVLMAHKYARSTAVLRQTPMAILLYSDPAELEIISMKTRAGTDARNMFLDGRDNRAAADITGFEDGVEGEAPAIESELVRKLGRDVKLEAFRSERGGQEYDGVYWINYHPNGMSDGFELVLSDKKSRKVEITSDAISGKVEAEFDRF
jgi:prepilin-type N-terminal cleavage/methylation domain-containing protein